MSIVWFYWTGSHITVPIYSSITAVISAFSGIATGSLNSERHLNEIGAAGRRFYHPGSAGILCHSFDFLLLFSNQFETKRQLLIDDFLGHIPGG